MLHLDAISGFKVLSVRRKKHFYTSYTYNTDIGLTRFSFIICNAECLAKKQSANLNIPPHPLPFQCEAGILSSGLHLQQDTTF